MFLKGFINELAIVDSEENKERLIIEAINDDDIIDNEDATVMDLFGDKPLPVVTKNIDPDFENILVNMEIPDDMPEDRKRDYITDLIDKSMGIEHKDPIIAVPQVEAAGDIKEDKSKGVLTMKSADKEALLQIINTYNEDVQHKTKNAVIIKTFIRNVLQYLNSGKEKVSASIKVCVDRLYEKFCTQQDRAQVAARANTNRGKDSASVAELKTKLDDISRNIH